METEQLLQQVMMRRPSAPNVDPVSVEMQLAEAMQQRQRAYDTRNQQSNGPQGWGTTLAAAIRPFAANKQDKRANASLVEALGQKGKLGQYDAQLAEWEAEKKRIEAIQDFQRKEKIKDNISDENKVGDRSYTQDEWDRQHDITVRDRAPSPSTTINLEGGGKAWEAFQKEAPARLKEWEGGAAQGATFLRVADDMTATLEDYGSGRTQNALATIGRYLPEGTDLNILAGNQEKFELAANQALGMALEKMRGLGQMTEVEFKKATEELAKFGSTKAANEYAIKTLREKSQRSIDTYDNALEYLNSEEFGQFGFAKYRPAYTASPSNQPEAAPQTAEGSSTQGASDEIHVNPETGEKIKWNGKTWVIVK